MQSYFISRSIKSNILKGLIHQITINFTIALAFLWTVLNASAAHAQDAPIEPSLNPNNTWCTSFSPDNSLVCGFSDPNAMCDYAMQNFYPRDTDILRNVTVATSGKTAFCETDADTIRMRGRLWKGSPSGGKNCERGLSLNGDQCVRIQQGISNSCVVGGTSHMKGNPIDLISGIKVQSFTDYSTADGRFTFTRSYASRSYGDLNNSQTGVLGRGWSVENLPRMAHVSIGRTTVFLPGHQAISVRCGSSGCITSATRSTPKVGAPRAQLDESDPRFISDLTQAQNTIPFIDSGNIKYIFKSEEHEGGIYYAIRRVEYPGGYSIDYETRLIEEAMTNQDITQSLSPIRFIVEKMTDSFGRSMLFDYGQETWLNSEQQPRMIYLGGELVQVPSTVGLLKSVVLPDLSTLHFVYDSATDFGQEWNLSERLTSIYRTPPTSLNGAATPEGLRLSTETYHYENSTFPFALTGITDSKGIRYASWEYSDDGLAISSEHAGGVDRYDFEYDIPDSGLFFGPTVTETNPLGKDTIYKPESTGRYFIEIEGQPSANCVGDVSQITNFASRIDTVDKEGRNTRITKNTKGWQTSKTVTLDGVSELVSSTTWHPTFRLPLQRVMPGITYDYTYDEEGRMLSMTQTDTSVSGAGSAPRIWTYGYDGINVTSIDGPLPGSADTQIYDYIGPRLTSVENELGHKTLITSHNPNGAPKIIQDPNGNETHLEYDLEHKLTAIIESVGNLNARTQLAYDRNDQLTLVRQPNGSEFHFEYDDARRLMAIRNSVGERIDYTRNNMGGVTSIVISGGESVATFSITRVTDELNRMIKTATIGGTAGFTSETKLGYDREDNLTSIIDPRQNSWQQSYDGLNRLVKEIDPLGAQTDYELAPINDNRNPLSSVKDARNVTTNYIRNGFGEVIREVSLEAGITEYTRDERGLVTQMTDARGVVTNYAYDDAGRLLSGTYPSETASDITYTYDEGPNGIGELTTVTESFGTTSYAYNSLGQMTEMTRTINGQSYSTAYTYDLTGEVLSETYPSGRVLRMVRDAAERIISIETKGPGETEFTSLLTNVTYLPFGPISGASFGDGHELNIDYDTAYRAKSLSRTTDTSSLMDITFEHDESGNILVMNDNVRPERSQSFTYDPVSRLTSAQNTGTGGYGSIGYEYNLGGDRTARNYTPVDATLQSQIYNYDSTTARLTDITQAGSTLRLFGYDDSGQVISDTRSDDIITTVFEYGLNARGRLSTVSEEGALKASYTYDMSEQRIVKAVAGATAIHYHYDGEGRLISETDAATGDTLREYVWHGLTPIAVFNAAAEENCEEEITALEDQIADRTNRIDRNAARITELEDLALDKQDRITANAARITELEALATEKQERISVNTVRITELEALEADKQNRIAANAERITELEALIVDKQNQIAALNPATRADRIAQLEALIIGHQDRIAFLNERNAALAALIVTHQERIAFLEERNNVLTALITTHEERITFLSTRNAELTDLAAGHDERIVFLTERNVILTNQRESFEQSLETLRETGCENAAGALNYLHSDHLGRPKFATDSAGNVTWDGGINTPFGIQITALAAQTQALMFPGQYADAETTGAGVTLSHNWHRTYDPTIGRYLQSDPIGLAGGLNRYAYVGGNPVMLVDPTGEIAPLLVVGAGFLIGAALDFGVQYYHTGGNLDCISKTQILISGISSALPAGRLGYVLGARNISKVATSNAQAYAMRQSLKARYRFGFFPPKMAFKPGKHTIESAGRTNPFFNALGVVGGIFALGNILDPGGVSENCECQ